MTATQRLRRDRAKKKLRTLLSRTDKTQLLRTMWVLDRAWFDPDFKLPRYCNFPVSIVGAEAGDVNAIYPWEIETLVTEILASSRNVGRRIGNANSWQLVSNLINNLRTIEDAEYGVKEDISLPREMSLIGFRQMRWQSNNWHGAEFVRWWSIFQDPKLREVFEDRIGTSIKSFVVVGVIWSEMFKQNWQSKKLINKDISWLTNKDVDAAISALSAPIEDLWSVAVQTISSSSSTAYRRGVLRQSPVISISSGGETYFTCPIGLLLKWRISSGLYYDVIGDRRVVDGNLIGKGYEQYVRDLTQAILPFRTVTGDLSYGTKRRPKRTPDVIVAEGRKVKIIIECKASKIPLAVQTTTDDSIERQRVVFDLAKGVAQVCEFWFGIAGGLQGCDFELAEDPAGVVVALDEWILFSNDLKADIISAAKDKLKNDGFYAAIELVDSVIICTIDEWELFCTVFEPAAFDQIIKYAALPTNRAFSFGSILSTFKEHRRQVPNNPLSGRVEEFLKSAFKNV